MPTMREIVEAIRQVQAERRAVDEAVREAHAQVYGVRAGARQARMLRVMGAGWVPTYAEPVCLAPELPEYEAWRRRPHPAGFDGALDTNVTEDEFYVRRVLLADGGERWLLVSRFDHTES